MNNEEVKPEVDVSPMRILGMLVLIGAVIYGLGVMDMETSVATDYGRVNNIGLMHDQTLKLTMAGFGFIAGILMTVLGK